MVPLYECRLLAEIRSQVVRLSALEKSPGCSRRIPKNLKFAVVTRSKFSRADPQNNEVGGRNRLRHSFSPSTTREAGTLTDCERLLALRPEIFFN